MDETKRSVKKVVDVHDSGRSRLTRRATVCTVQREDDDSHADGVTAFQTFRASFDGGSTQLLRAPPPSALRE